MRLNARASESPQRTIAEAAVSAGSRMTVRKRPRGNNRSLVAQYHAPNSSGLGKSRWTAGTEIGLWNQRGSSDGYAAHSMAWTASLAASGMLRPLGIGPRSEERRVGQRGESR